MHYAWGWHLHVSCPACAWCAAVWQAEMSHATRLQLANSFVHVQSLPLNACCKYEICRHSLQNKGTAALAGEVDGRTWHMTTMRSISLELWQHTCWNSAALRRSAVTERAKQA